MMAKEKHHNALKKIRGVPDKLLQEVAPEDGQQEQKAGSEEEKKYGFMRSELSKERSERSGQAGRLFWDPPKCIQKKRLIPVSELGNRLPLGVNYMKSQQQRKKQFRKQLDQVVESKQKT